MKNKGVFLALGAGISWGVSLGIFARLMTGMGFTAMQMAAVRTTMSAAMFIVLALIKDRKAFRIDIKDSWIFLCIGVISLTLNCYCYFTTTTLCSIAVAGILQYTGPVWVVLLSAAVFRERITPVKAAAMTIAVLGCVLVSGITGGTNTLSALGMAIGLLSGLTYASQTIFTRFAVQKYSALTINIYIFIIASASSLLMAGPVKTLQAALAPEALPIAIAGGIMCSALPCFLYTKALECIDNGKATIFATIEPVCGAAVSVFYFHEPMSIAALAGIALILGAIILLALRRDNAKTSVKLTEN